MTAYDEELRTTIIKDSIHIRNSNKYPRHVLKTKCIFKHKCEQKLKQKFLKYKLRKNGEEDPDVLAVSHILLSGLKIKSPKKQLKSPELHCNSEVLRPKNYLFNMARRKLKAKNVSSEVPGAGTDNKGVSPMTESQEKVQKNAFKLLMDSRNKSIGSNSPGKEKSIDPRELQEMIENKNTKVKRILALQKMAEAKGASVKKELEEQQETYVKHKMEERAERLKHMLAKQKKAKISMDPKKSSQKKVNKLNHDGNPSKHYNRNGTDNDTKPLQFIDIFEDVIKPSNNVKPDKKIIPKEDEEFLKKLSPSIRKKENMLSYFRKIEKTPESCPEIEETVVGSDTVIKVKMIQKGKKKIKKKKLSLNKESSADILKDHNEKNKCKDDTVQLSDDTAGEICSERKKRKRNENSVEVETANIKTIVTTASIETEEKRPKRSVKRPVKYNDDVQLSSSDDDLHIFTPKKRKHRDNISKHLIKEEHKIIISDDESNKKASSKSKKTTDQQKDSKVQKKPTKLAPIFAPKIQLNPEQLEAKQKFLYSGVPDQIKKIIANQNNLTTEINNDFPVVVHIQQIGKTKNDVISEIFPIQKKYDAENYLHVEVASDFYKQLIVPKKLDTSLNIPSLKSNSTKILQTIKEHYPKFPVYRTFRSLKNKSKGVLKESIAPELDNSIEVIDGITDVVYENPYYLNWTEKYKATSTKQLIGNFESIKELKQWLLFWIENEAKSKNTPTNESDSSDFYDSDSNSKDSIQSIRNLLILNGPVGSGKTSSVYAVASELAMKVIEVNASSKRTGKMMLQDLQEATQSHKVNRAGLESTQKSQESVDGPIINDKKKRGRPKKAIECTIKKPNSKNEISSQSSVSQESGRTGMSLILVDDADIVFDQDDGFASAIAQLAQISKRPVILVTGSLSCPHLQKFVQCGKIINMRPLSPRMLGTWLDIMCLSDTGTCLQGLGAKFLDYFKGDIRKSINCLQFYMTAYTKERLQGDEATSQNSDCKSSSDDENSNMSWVDGESADNKRSIESFNYFNNNDELWKYFMSQQFNLAHLSYPKDLLNVWWSIPNLLNRVCKKTTNNKTKNLSTQNSKEQNLKELESISCMIDNISLSEYFSCNKPDASLNITSQPWYFSENDSVSEDESLDNYSKTHEVTNDIIQELLTGSIIATQNTLHCKSSLDVNSPDMAVLRGRNRIVSRHESLANIFIPAALLDRKALALDYWSTCRTICRIEKNKTDTVSKRNNRFCHYLKSLNTMGGSSMFSGLADSLQLEGKDE